MFRSRATIIGIILIILAFAMHYITTSTKPTLPEPERDEQYVRALGDDTRAGGNRPAPSAPAPAPAPPVQPPPLRPVTPSAGASDVQLFKIAVTPLTPDTLLIEEFECSRIIDEIKKIDAMASQKAKTVAEYNYECVNIFVPKITSSKEQDMKLVEQHPADAGAPPPEKRFKLILNSADISYVGYFNTPDGIVAMLRVNNADMNIVKAGDTISGSNLRLRSANERFAVLESLIDRSASKVYISQR